MKFSRLIWGIALIFAGIAIILDLLFGIDLLRIIFSHEVLTTIVAIILIIIGLKILNKKN